MAEMIKKNEKKINDSLLLFKIIIIGCSNVGKTEILNSFITNCIFKNNTKPTVGISFVSAKDIIDNNLVRFQIWDTAGEERYRSVIINYFKKAKGALIVYDITNEESFEQLDYLYNELKNQTDAEIILVGNKLDLSNERKIDYNIGENKAKSYNASFFEVSAKNKENIDEVFKTLFKKIFENHKNEDNDGLIFEEPIPTSTIFENHKNKDNDGIFFEEQTPTSTKLIFDEPNENSNFNYPSFKLNTNTKTYGICC